MRNRITARAPSSTANLGPGFDVFGLALDAFYDEIRLTKAAKTSIVTSDGIPTIIQKNTAGLVVRKMSAEFDISDGVEILIKKGVPAGFGMGSSAASAAAAAVAFDKLFGLKLDGESLVRFAGMGERASAGSIHYDNVAASVLGGFVVVRERPLNIIRIDPPEDLVACVAIPTMEVPDKKTQVSRGAIPSKVRMADSTENLGNAAAIVAGFMKGDMDLIGSSMRDVIVEPARRRMIPGFARVKANALEAGALGVSISGAGPSVIALAKKTSDLKGISDSMEKGFDSARTKCQVMVCRPAAGAAVTE